MGKPRCPAWLRRSGAVTYERTRWLWSGYRPEDCRLGVQVRGGPTHVPAGLACPAGECWRCCSRAVAAGSCPPWHPRPRALTADCRAWRKRAAPAPLACCSPAAAGPHTQPTSHHTLARARAQMLLGWAALLGLYAPNVVWSTLSKDFNASPALTLVVRLAAAAVPLLCGCWPGDPAQDAAPLPGTRAAASSQSSSRFAPAPGRSCTACACSRTREVRCWRWRWACLAAR